MSGIEKELTEPHHGAPFLILDAYSTFTNIRVRSQVILKWVG
jgi:hypothetical protein